MRPEGPSGPVGQLQRRILQILAAGPGKGFTTADLMDALEPNPPGRRQSHINDNLHSLLGRDLVARESSHIRSRGAPYRWHVTAKGRSAALQPMRKDTERLAHERHVARLERSRAALAEAREQGHGPQTPVTARLEVILQLRDSGCTLAQIGELLGLTRERIRQLANRAV